MEEQLDKYSSGQAGIAPDSMDVYRKKGRESPRKKGHKRIELLQMLEQKAAGYTTEERVEEYTCVDGELQITKLKKSFKQIQPDLAALKMYLELSKGTGEEFTETQLLAERNRLLKLLKEEEENAAGKSKSKDTV